MSRFKYNYHPGAPIISIEDAEDKLIVVVNAETQDPHEALNLAERVTNNLNDLFNE